MGVHRHLSIGPFEVRNAVLVLKLLCAWSIREFPGYVLDFFGQVFNMCNIIPQKTQLRKIVKELFLRLSDEKNYCLLKILLGYPPKQLGTGNQTQTGNPFFREC